MPPRSRPQRRKDADVMDERMNRIHGLTARIARGGAGVTADELAVFVKEFYNVGIPLFMANLDDATAIDFFTLFSLALRQSNAESREKGSVQLCYRKLRKGISSYLSELFAAALTDDDDMVRKALLVRLVLRTQAFSCYSILLRDTGRQLQQRPSHSTAEAAAELLSEVMELVGTLEHASMRTYMPGEDTDTNCVQKFAPLATELRSSALLDAWASCFLQLVASGACGSSEEAAVLLKLTQALQKLLMWSDFGVTSLCAPGPGIMYLLSAHVVRAVAMLDGGTTYGVAADAPQVPVWNSDRGVVRSGNGGVLDARLLVLALKFWGHMLSTYTDAPAPAAAALPPYHRPATFDLCIRLLGAAVAAVTAPVAAAQQQQQQQQRRRLNRVLLQRESCGEVARLALARAEEALRELVGRRPTAVRPEDAERLRTFWTAHMRVLDAAMESLADEEAKPAAGGSAASASAAVLARPELGTSFCGAWKGMWVWAITGMTPVAAGPPTLLGAEAAAILSAGVVARNERLMRLRYSSAKLLCGVEVWAEVLMFGPAAEVAALIATAGKYIRECLHAVKKYASDPPKRGSDDYCWYEHMVHRRIPEGFTAVAGFLEGAMHWQSEGAAAGVLGAGWGDGIRGNLEHGDTSQSVRAAVSDEGAVGSGSGGGSEAGNGRGGDAGSTATGGNAGEGRDAGDGSPGSSSASGGCRAGGGGGSDGPGPAPGAPQLLDLTSFTIVRLLPALAATVQCLESPALESMATICKCLRDVFAPYAAALRGCWVPLTAAALSVSEPGAVAAPSAAQWRALLLDEVDVVGLLGAAAKALSTRDGQTEQGDAPVCGEAFAETLRLACAAFPDAMRAAMAVGPQGPVAPCVQAGAESAAVAAAIAPVPAGSCEVASGPSTAAAGAGQPRRAFLSLPNITELLGPSGDFPNARALAAVNALMDAGGAPVDSAVDACMAAVAAVLPPPDEVRRRMAAHCCANKACLNLAGPSELSLPRHRCGGACGGSPWWYCSRECQVAHWRAGHAAECKAVGASGPGGSQGPAV
ncbi:hypothetical protein PLESTB_001196600 [Pleodorina starrii]|uniref:MYND-type domain-containing protein n=1 Tax=Pleodorina starrii TaxID=330485 RepID=A0A9W6BSZ7_9CHLO|nr:hypothetical protein PLESTM_001834100 [Pleodorina starrii]GLC57187.1 hypothetical protein PLESTB_001196600 [Pleodorina starrii]GLC71432.1 hypothetical protein PLESTF_001115300 [Pleodorina starrii]